MIELNAAEQTTLPFIPGILHQGFSFSAGSVWHTGISGIRSEMV